MPGWISKFAQVVSAAIPMGQRMARRIRARRRQKARAIDELRRNGLRTPDQVEWDAERGRD